MSLNCFAASQELLPSECEVWKDPQKIFHLRTLNEKTGLACMGYAHGRDRAWEMDFFRRTVRGEVAEVLGYRFIQSDFFMRLLGLSEKAKTIWTHMSLEDQDLMYSYVKGVNQGIQAALKQGVYEFKNLGYSPDEWKPEDSIALMFLQSFDQTKKSFLTQIDEEKWKQTKGNQQPQKWFSSDELPWDTTILKDGEYSKKNDPVERLNANHQTNSEAILRTESSIVKSTIVDIFGGTAMGSNNWVVAPTRSQTGVAWLANDPHLKLGHPPFWQWLHLNTQSTDVIGATFPGIPLIVSGTNRFVSWGVTNSVLPVSRLSYVPEADLKESQKFRPWIWVKVLGVRIPFLFKSFRRTPTGLPILPIDSPSGTAAVLRWTGYDLKPSDFLGLYQVMRARSAHEADQAFSRIGVPSWNFVFADVNGNIGYRAVGRIPRFKKDPPFGIPTQSLTDVEHSPEFEYPMSSDEIPHLFNPKRGFLATANNRQWPTDSQLSVGKAQLIAMRAFRIEELLQSTPRHDLESMQRIQCDTQAVDARFLVADLIKVVESRAGSQSALNATGLELLKSWDFNATTECRACPLYRRWVDLVLEKEGLNIPALYRELKQGAKESLKKEIIHSFEVALKEVSSEKNEFPNWGTFHRVSFDHWAGDRLKPKGVHSREVGSPGDDFTVNLGTSEWTGKYFHHLDGPSQRMIVEMSQPPKVYSVLAGPNEDMEDHDLTDPNSEWQRWVQCKQQRRLFPLEWKQVQNESTRLTF